MLMSFPIKFEKFRCNIIRNDLQMTQRLHDRMWNCLHQMEVKTYEKLLLEALVLHTKNHWQWGNLYTFDSCCISISIYAL